MQPWIAQPIFVVTPAWETSAPKQDRPAFDDSEANKQLFGIALAKGSSPFEAASAIFPIGNGASVWVAQNWIADPIAIAAKDQYLQSLEKQSKNLDKEEFAAKVLAFADEIYEINGVKRYVNDGKDRLGALGLYAKVKGYIQDKPAVEIDNSKTTTNNNFMQIKLVGGSKHDNALDQVPNVQSKMLNEDTMPIQLKLVGGVER